LDRKQLKKELIPFCEEFKNKYPATEIIQLVESMPGLAGTPYAIKIIAEIPDSKYYDAIADACKILWENVNSDARSKIVDIRIDAEDYTYFGMQKTFLLYNEDEPLQWQINN